jgi:hypothetical protein
MSRKHALQRVLQRRWGKVASTPRSHRVPHIMTVLTLVLFLSVAARNGNGTT